VRLSHLLSVASAAALLATPIAAQDLQLENPPFVKRLSFSLAARWVEPVEAFARNVNYGMGLSGSLGYHLPGFKPLAIRTELSHHWYGWESKRVQLSPTANRVFVDMNTTNNIFVWTIGPELAYRNGPVQPYALWQAGFSNFYTKSSVRDEDTGTTFAESTNMDDYGWAIEYGGGVRFSVQTKGNMRTSIDIGGRMTVNGTREYLRSGDIFDLPNGSLVFNTRETPTNFFQFTLGIALSGR
jgi:hypothetical protein